MIGLLLIPIKIACTAPMVHLAFPKKGEQYQNWMEDSGDENQADSPSDMPSQADKSKLRSAPLTIGDHLTYLLPRLEQDRSAPRWPPDMFGLCMGLLCKAGAYCQILENWPPEQNPPISATEWATQVGVIGRDWRTRWPKNVPGLVDRRWKTITGAWQLPVTYIVDNPEISHALLEICAVADEASEGFWLPGSPGTLGTGESKAEERNFFEHGYQLHHHIGVSTLCDEIDSSRSVVLPKCRTPQNGLTSRSLSHHLSLCSADEIKPRWIIGPYGNAEELSLNLLLVPWPPVVKPKQFKPTSPLKNEMRNMPPGFSFFTYNQIDTEPDVTRVVEDLYKVAVDKMGRIDAVLLPEAALTKEQHSVLSDLVIRKGSFLISGVSAPSDAEKGEHGQNLLYVDLPSVTPLVQHKHHRWKLNQTQIAQYGLGSRLYPEKLWWEHISLSYRTLNFIAALPWLIMSVLICEDLARPDPVGDLVRAVGPNLVIALLMDGPQLKERWGARYATALADDPGSSVLTLTSTGMCNMSRPEPGVTRSRVIALWKDVMSPIPVEIELPAGSDGAVISLSIRRMKEWSADGRGDSRNAGYPILSGVHHLASK